MQYPCKHSCTLWHIQERNCNHHTDRDRLQIYYDKMKLRVFFFFFSFPPLLHLHTPTVSQFVGFVNPMGPFWMCHISVNCRRQTVWNSGSPLLAAPALDSPLPSGSDSKCTPVFISARLLWGRIRNRFWQGDLCYRQWWSLRSLLNKKGILSGNKVRWKKKKVSLHYLIQWSSACYRGNWKMEFHGW